MTTVKLVFRASKQQDKEGVICYRICHQRQSLVITTDMRVHSKDWNTETRSLVINSPSDKTALYIGRIEAELSALQDIVKRLEQSRRAFSLDEVVERFRTRGKGIGILEFADRQARQLFREGRFSTARNYERTRRSFAEFLENRDIELASLCGETVKAYETWLKNRNLSRNSSSFYLRVLRAIYNKAVGCGIIRQANPFSGVYTGIARTRKRAVDETILVELQRLDLSFDKSLQVARDLFLFSYSARGMAFVDMAYLKAENLSDGRLCYTRRKTGQELEIRIEPCMRQILNRYAENSKLTSYLLPILSSQEPHKAFNQYEKALNLYNRKLKQLSRLIVGSPRLCSYTSRHSWATAARNHNVPLQIICAAMGHTSEKTTLIYLDSLNGNLIDQANSEILRRLNSQSSFAGTLFG